jgi:hypothetical protein
MGIPGDRRAWDRRLDGQVSIGVEAETGLRDLQAIERAMNLKRQDSGVTRMILLVADTSRNRRLLREHAAILRSTFPLSTREVLQALRQNVRWLDVAVHNPVPVGDLQRRGHFGGDAYRALGREPAMPGDQLRQVSSGNQLHDDELVTRVRPVIVNGHDVRVGEAGGPSRFEREALREFRFAAQPRPHELHRHVALKLPIARAVYRAHAPAAMALVRS